MISGAKYSGVPQIDGHTILIVQNLRQPEICQLDIAMPVDDYIFRFQTILQKQLLPINDLVIVKFF